MSILIRLPPAFRQRCESIATERRNLLSLRAYDPLPAVVLAANLEAELLAPDQVKGIDSETATRMIACDTWSAFILQQQPLQIVYHPLHSPARHESNLMHEFAHVLLNHTMVRFDPKSGLPQRRPRDEDEATYLGGCLQIPRRGLHWALQREMTIKQIAAHFGASQDMVRFRANTIGVTKTFSV
jgi:Zn-dependent peptidase ImmA (M78 family)